MKSNEKILCSTLQMVKFFKYEQYLKILKNIQKYTCEYRTIMYLTSQNSSAIGMSLSGVIFNLVSLSTNEWTPPIATDWIPLNNSLFFKL